MALEVTWNCDVCGQVGGGAATRPDAIREAKDNGWTVLRVDGTIRTICRKCAEGWGDNKLRAQMRAAYGSDS